MLGLLEILQLFAVNDDFCRHRTRSEKTHVMLLCPIDNRVVEVLQPRPDFVASCNTIEWKPKAIGKAQAVLLCQIDAEQPEQLVPLKLFDGFKPGP